MNTLRTALALIRLRFDRSRVRRAARNAASPEEAAEIIFAHDQRAIEIMNSRRL